MRKNIFVFAVLGFIFYCGNAQNLIDSSSWVAGTTGAATDYGVYGDTDESSRINMTGPHGNQVVAWQAESTSNGRGGFIHDGVLVDTDKSYRLTYWVKSEGSCNNRVGEGFKDSSGTDISSPKTQYVNGGEDTYPRFFNYNLPDNKWYLVVGYVHPSGYQGSNLGAVYDLADWDSNNPNVLPVHDYTTNDVKFHSGYAQLMIVTISHLYGCAVGEKMYTYAPRVEEINGSETPLIELLSGNSATDNIAPTAPPSLVLLTAPTSTTADISWNASTDNVGVTAYKVYQDDNMIASLGSNESSYQATGLSASTTYVFKVRALDAAGNESSPSSSLSVTTDSSGGNTGGGDSGLWSKSGSTITHLTESDNVAIGTDVVPAGHKLAVNGSIITTEVLVKLKVNWADYVFKENYKLPTLEEVARHIEEKGHLMNIPSAKEVETNGIELGEMNSLLLEKIEENMLYILELKKEIEVLKKDGK